MRTGGQLSFEYEWERPDSEPDEKGILLQVEATISDYFPAVNYLPNGDPGYPEEGGECENLTVFLPDRTELRPIPDSLYELLARRAEDEYSERSDDYDR